MGPGCHLTHLELFCSVYLFVHSPPHAFIHYLPHPLHPSHPAPSHTLHINDETHLGSGEGCPQEAQPSGTEEQGMGVKKKEVGVLCGAEAHTLFHIWDQRRERALNGPHHTKFFYDISSASD